MINKIFKVVLKIVIVIVAYLTQMYVINNVNFFGVKGDICLMLIVVFALLEKTTVAYITCIICAILSNMLFSFGSIKYIFIYLIVVAVLLELKKTYNQDSKISIIIFAVIATVLNELVMFILMAITGIGQVNVFLVLFNIIKECIINIALAYVLYLLFKLCKQEE